MSLLGVVLAGGRSSRMGQDKAAMVWRGRSFLEHQVNLLKEAGCDAVVVVGRHDSRWPSLPDEQPFRGPVVALAHILNKLAGMFAVVPGKMLMVPVDMPLVVPGDLVPLIRHRAPLAAFARHPFPCGLAVTEEAVRAVTAYAAQSGASMTGLWDLIPGAVWLPAEDDAFLTNINTPGEWETLKGSYGDMCS